MKKQRESQDDESHGRQFKGGQLVIDVHTFGQNGKRFGVGIMPHSQLDRVAYVDPFTKDNEHGDERPYDANHARKFRDDIDNPRKRATRPQSIVVTLSNGAYFVDETAEQPV